MKKLVAYLLKTPRYKFIVISIGSVLVWTFIASLIGYLTGTKISHQYMFLDKSLFYKFNIVVLVGPLIETFLFQYVFIEFLLMFSKRYLVLIIISGLIFGASHYPHFHNFLYSFFAFIAGFLFASIYIISKKRKDLNAFYMVFLVHSCSNLIAFLVGYIISR